MGRVGATPTRAPVDRACKNGQQARRNVAQGSTNNSFGRRLQRRIGGPTVDFHNFLSGRGVATNYISIVGP